MVSSFFFGDVLTAQTGFPVELAHNQPHPLVMTNFCSIESFAAANPTHHALTLESGLAKLGVRIQQVPNTNEPNPVEDH